MPSPTGRRPFRAAEPAPQPDPPGLAARMAAVRGVTEIAAGRAMLDEKFGGDADAMRGDLDPRDRALARSIATVTFRRLGTLRAAVARFLESGLPKKAPGLEWILITGAAQILFLDTPDHAAVDLAVRMARRDPKTTPFAGLVNAVLRAVARERAELIAAPSDPFLDVPAWLAARWRNAWGEDRAAQIALRNRDEPTLDLTVKSDASGWAARLGGVVLPTGSVRLDSHAPIVDFEGYSQGEWWVQDAAAALPARFLLAQPGERVADLCAAPGGKTAQLALAGARVVAVDKSAERLKRVAANLDRLHLAAEPAVADALSYSAEPFDAVLLDAPCSATGTVRRRPDVSWTKRASDIASLSALQSKMLDRAAALTRPGGRLVYCVCSIELDEGETQIAALLRRNPDLERWPIEPDEVGGASELLTTAGELRTLPCHFPAEEPRRAGLDGFFAARLRRRNQG